MNNLSKSFQKCHSSPLLSLIGMKTEKPKFSYKINCLFFLFSFLFILTTNISDLLLTQNNTRIGQNNNILNFHFSLSSHVPDVKDLEARLLKMQQDLVKVCFYQNVILT